MINKMLKGNSEQPIDDKRQNCREAAEHNLSFCVFIEWKSVNLFKMGNY